MNIILTFSGAILMVWASFKDVKSFTIPYLSIIGVFLMGLLLGLHNLAGALVVGGLLFLSTYVSQRFYDKVLIGYGDIQLLTAALVWVDLNHYPVFFITCGTCGVLLSLIARGQKYFPLAPAIATAWFVSITF
jgi:Flp pilus assembly protein protease CpaA